MKHLCLDYGQKRTGIAVSDPGGSMAFPRRALVKKTREQFFGELVDLIRLEEAQIIVLGLPLRSDGSDSLTTRQVRNFAESLKRRVDLPVYFMEETLSSAEAEAMLKESGQHSRDNDGRLDSLAAMRILESFMALPESQKYKA